MIDIGLHPSLLLVLFAVVLWIVPERLLRMTKLIAAFVVLVVVYYLPVGTQITMSFINQMQLQVLSVDSMNWTFAIVLLSMFFLAQLYGMHANKRGEILASFVYGAGAIGSIFAGDWVTLLFFWELMAISSTFLVWYGGTKYSTKAGIRYLIYHFFGGNLLLFGVLLKVFQGDMSIGILTGNFDLAFWLIFLGIAVNAALPPFHTWLTDAYPETSVSGIVFMNIFTTKVAVFMLMKVFPGQEFLIWLGIGMAIYGVLYAILENHIRRLLSYHIVSQVGLIIAAIGIGTEMAINGAFALTIGNILFKSLLFMSCGVIITTTNRWKLTDLGGLYNRMPVNAGLFLIGALAIAGVPFLNGYVGKVLVAAAGAEYHKYLSIAIYVASVGTVLSIPLKLGYFGFVFQKEKGHRVEMNGTEQSLMKSMPHMYIAMSIIALVCIGLGLFPQWFYAKLPYPVEYSPYSLYKVLLEFLFMGGIVGVFAALMPRLTAKKAISIDFDWFLRLGLVSLVKRMSKLIGLFGEGVEKRSNVVRDALAGRFSNFEPDRNRKLLEMIIAPPLLVFVISIVIVIAFKL